jgi:hypothetical protein
MLWNPAYLGAVGVKPVVSSTLPNLTSPVMAVDVSQTSSLFQDVNGTSAVTTAGQLVARANNLANSANFYNQSFSTGMPTYRPNSVGTNAALNFKGRASNGDYDTYGLAGVSAGGGTIYQSLVFTILCVFRRTEHANTVGVFCAGNSTGGANNAGYDCLQIECGTTGPPALIRNSGSGTSRVTLSNPSYADNQVMKFVGRADATNGIEIRCKSASGSFTGTGPAPTGADQAAWNTSLLGTELGLNGTSAPQNPFAGDLFEFRFWASRATDAQFSQMQGYLDLRYG